MKLKEFFNSALVSLPKGGFDDQKETFDQFLETRFGNYLRQLQSIHDPEFPEFNAALSDLVKASQKLADSLMEAIQASLSGRAHIAYQEDLEHAFGARLDAVSLRAHCNQRFNQS